MSLDFGKIVEKLFKVELKEAGPNGKIAPFKLNASQRELDASTRTYNKHVILKARQLGISTYILARLLAKCLTVPGTHAAIISHDRDSTIKLNRRVKFMIDMLREDGIAVNTDYDSKTETTFPDTHSSLYIGTAGAKLFSRGDTLTDVHCSEVAFWENAPEIMRSILGALTPNGEIFLESTANGAGGYFYDMCQKSMGAHPEWVKFALKPGESEWRFHFYPWTDEPLYRAAVPSLVPFWTKEERDLHEEDGLTWTQIMWRRKKLEDYASVDDFLAEYPLTPDEAFVVTGACYFDKPTLRLYQRLMKEPIATGVVEMVGQQPRFNRFKEEAPLWVWEHARAGMEYLITADCSEGLEDSESDSTVAQVLNRSTFKQVAVLAGKIDPGDTAGYLYALGAYYGWCWIAVEANGPGLACLLKLKDLGYPRIYYHTRIDAERGVEEAQKIGWSTDARTRTPMLSELRTAIKKQQYHMVDARLLKECTTFCRQKDGGFRANSSCHDDHVMSAAIGVYLHNHLPMDQTIAEGTYRPTYAPTSSENFSHGSSSKTGY